MLTKSEFQILNLLRTDSHQTQRSIAASMGKSLGKVNQDITKLQNTELLKKTDYSITKKGLKALEPYKVKNAVIMAAGMSPRFAPLTYEKPKALLKVKGDVLIEREIRQLQEAGIRDIIVVVGYMKEKLFYLADKFGIKIVVNENYYRYSNPSTLMMVLDTLDNTYVCSSDNYFPHNPFETYVYHAYYPVIFSTGKINEYCVNQTDRNGRITKAGFGGKDCWYMLGHVYFDRAFSKEFSHILKAEYDNLYTKEQFWEDLYIKHIKELDMEVRKYDSSEIKEFDNLDELRLFDNTYLNNTDSKIIDHICSVLHCQEEDVKNINPIKSGLTNMSFFFSCKGKDYVYRHPGVGTDAYINRESEAASMKIAKELGLDDTYIYIDPVNGWKISHFIHDAKTLDYHNPSHVKQAMKMLRTLHTSCKKTDHDFDIWLEIANFEKLLENNRRNGFEDSSELKETIRELRAYVSSSPVEKCLCHCDSYDPNFLIDKKGKMYLIDWEYSGMSDPAGDIGTFLSCSDYTIEEAKKLIEIYLNHKPTKKEMRHYIAYGAILSYYWFIWALYQDSVGKTVGEWTYLWYQHTKMYGKEALMLYEQ